MASFDSMNSKSDADRLDLRRCALTGATVLPVLFALCWIGAALNLMGVAHVYLAAIGGATIATLIVGLICSAAGGALIGMLVAFTYNAFAFVTRR